MNTINVPALSQNTIYLSSKYLIYSNIVPNTGYGTSERI